MEFEEIDRSVNLDARAGVFCRLFGVFEELRRARVDVAWKQHRCHAAITRAVEFFGELDGFLQPFAAACIVPVVFQPTLTVVKETDVLVTRTGGAANADLIHHVDILLRLSSRAADLECRGHAAPLANNSEVIVAWAAQERITGPDCPIRCPTVP